MRELFLTRFIVQNFRSLGSVDIVIPAEPGVVVLEGPNGLGKTTFFEAIEMALTGSVFRWDDLGTAHKVDLEKYAKRIDAAETSCQVEIGFTGAGGKETARWSKAGEHEPALWLCDKPDAWGMDKARLPKFLRGTHVLTQSPHLRLLHLPAEERWDKVLSNVSGYSDIDTISKALNEVDGALTAKCREAATAVTSAKNASENWTRRTAELRSKELTQQAGGALFTPSASRVLLDASDQCRDMPADTPDGAMGELGRLAPLVVELRSLGAKASMDAIAVTELRTIPVDWATACASMKTAAEALVARQSDEKEATAQLRRASEALEQHSLEVSQLDSALQSSRARLSMAREANQLQHELTGAREASSSARESQMVCVNELARAKESVTTLTNQRSARGKWEEQDAAFEGRAMDLDTTRTAWNRLQEVRAELTVRVEDGQIAFERRTAHVSDLGAAEAELARLERQQVAELERAEAARTKTSALKRLLAELIAHVKADDTTCPVCRAEYPAAGELLHRATVAQSEEDATLSQLETALRDAQSATDAQRQRVTVAREAVSVAEASLASIQHLQAELQSEETNLRSRIPPCEAGTEQKLIQDLVSTLDRERASHCADDSSELPSTTLIDRELRAKTEVLQQAELALRAADDNERLIADEIAYRNARCTHIKQQLNIVDETPWNVVEERLLKEEVEVEADFGRERAALESARCAKEAADQMTNLATHATALALAVSSEATSVVGAIERRWVASGLDLPPSPEGIARELERLEDLKRTIENRIEGANSAAAGIQRWLELEQLQSVRRGLDREAGQSGTDGWGAHSVALQQTVVENEREERLAVRASKTVKAMKEEAGKRRTEMREALTTRLKPFLQPLLRTLLVNGGVAQSTIELGEYRRKTHVDALMGDRTPLVAVASEGQLAGVNLAIQLAMSQAFPWSRWRALLLDDPSQFSDVVHSASLIETLRALARRKRFQIILSTHDRDFAKYVCRKFVNEGLTTTRIAFREPPSDGGIVPRVVSSWNPHDNHEAASV